MKTFFHILNAVLLALVMGVFALMFLFPYSLPDKLEAPKSNARLLKTFYRLSGLTVRSGDADELFNMDSHGGFLGDGTWAAVLSCRNDALYRQISASSRWHALSQPLPEELSYALQHILYASAGADPPPEIQHGYYFFYNKQKKGEACYSFDGFFGQYSYNYYAALYDEETKTLYIYNEDT